MKDEAGSNLKDEENDFMLDNSYGDETLEELIVAVIMMAQIQPADDNVVTEPNYDAKPVSEPISEVNASQKMITKGVHEHMNHGKRKIVVNTFDDDKIDSNIIFDDPCVENNGGSDEHDSNAHDQYHDVKIMAYNTLKKLQQVLIEEVHEMLNIFESMEQIVKEKSSKDNIFQNEIDRLLEVSLTREIQDCVLISVEEQKNELLKDEIEKNLSDSKDIQANLLKRIKILENDFKVTSSKY
ncbi:hypothetical protein Tco_1026812 [Tanacetum coccineum]